MRMLVLLVLVVLVVLLLLAVRRRVQSPGEPEDAGRYRVLELTSGCDAQVFITRGSRESAVLIGSVPIADDEFGERYAELIVLAEDRASTLNASRELRDGR